MQNLFVRVIGRLGLLHTDLPYRSGRHEFTDLEFIGCKEVVRDLYYVEIQFIFM